MQDTPDKESIPAPAPAKKRRVRGYLACEACQRRKTRCELVTERGCLRCRTLDTPCSAAKAPTVLANGLSPSHSEAPRAAEPNGLSLITPSQPRGEGSTVSTVPVQAPPSWMARMEQLAATMLHQARHDQRSTTNLHCTPLDDVSELLDRLPQPRPDGVGGGDDMEPAIEELLGRSIGASLLVATGLNIHDRVVFRDPVAEKTLTLEGFRVMYEAYRQQFAKVVPAQRLLPRFEDVTHPFLRSSIVHFVTAGDRTAAAYSDTASRIRSISRHNVQRIGVADPSEDIMLGLLILSLKSLDATDARFARTADPDGLIGRAIHMALAAGLDDSATKARLMTTEQLMEIGSESLLRRALLWHTLTHRAAWVDILSSPAFATRPFTAPAASAVYSPQLVGEEPLIAHTIMEERLLSMIATVSAAIQRVRTEPYDDARVKLAEYAIQDFSAAVEQWQTTLISLNLSSAWWLQLQAAHIKMLLPHKFSTDLRVCVPYPIRDQTRMDIVDRLVGSFVPLTRDIVALIARSELAPSQLPAFALTLTLVPYHANAVVRRMHEDDVFVDSPDFGRFHQLLLESHPTAPSLMANLDQITEHKAWRRGGQDGSQIPSALMNSLPENIVEDLLRWLQSG